MASSFAVPQDLADLLHKAVDTAQATLLLAKASRILRREYPWVDARIADGSFDPLLAMDAVTSMAKRALLGSEGVKAEGLDGISVSYENAMGNLYLTASERTLMLGPRGLSVGSMRLGAGWSVPSGQWR